MKLKDIEKSTNKNLYLLFLSVLVGLTAGFLTSLYRLALEKAENLGLGIYSFTSSHLIFIPLLILALRPECPNRKLCLSKPNSSASLVVLFFVCKLEITVYLSPDC